jgi:hypothetical protein
VSKPAFSQNPCKVKFSFVCTQRFSKSGVKATNYNNDWENMNFCWGYENDITEVKKPPDLNKMIELAEALCCGIPFLRVDFFVLSGVIYVGELTFSPYAGFVRFKPKRFDATLGEWLILNNKKD